MTENHNANIIVGMFWMCIISLLLFWVPVFGALIAGIIGGKCAGGVLEGITAAALPGLVVMVFLFFTGTIMSSLPLVGAILAGGSLLLYLLYIPPLLLGALIGGLLAQV